MKITRRIALGAVGGFLAGNALWQILKLHPVVSMLIGVGVLYVAVEM
jgi:uncharacterized membrane protein (Fun14 family)